jgi:hypothetical protein
MQWYVDSRLGSDANDGRTPETAFRSLQHALHAAGAGDAVLIAPGAYDQDMPKQVSLLRQANIIVSVLGGH